MRNAFVVLQKNARKTGTSYAVKLHVGYDTKEPTRKTKIVYITTNKKQQQGKAEGSTYIHL